MTEKKEPIFGFIKCPYCGNLTRAATYTCQACGAVINPRTESPTETFTSQKRGEAAHQQGGQTSSGVSRQTSAIMPQNRADTFSSEGRQAANGGYTQQNTIAASQQNYAGVEAVGRDVFSSDNRKVYGRQFEVGKQTSGYEVFSSEKDAQRRSINEQTVSRSIGADQNPYENSRNVHFIDEIGTDIEEYTANDIFEFRRHRFGKRAADILDLLMGTMIAAVVLTLVAELVFTSPHEPVIFDVVTAAFSAITLLCVFTIKRTWNKSNVYFMSAIVILYSVFMIIGILVASHPEYRSGMSGGWNNAMALEPMMVFIPMAAIDVVSGGIIIYMAKLYALWEAYQRRDEDAAAAKQSDGEYFEVYKSGGENAENLQGQ